MCLGLDEPAIPLVPFHRVSPIIKSLRLIVPYLPSSRIFGLVLSFPLLEDLAVTIHDTSAENGYDSEEDEMQAVARPSNPPTFTGSLELDLFEGMKPFTRWLSSLPGAHFDVASRGKSLVGNGIGGGVFSYP
jgi:hypothetical protein